MYNRWCDQRNRLVLRHESHQFSFWFRFVIFAGHGKFHFVLLLICGIAMMGLVVENVTIGFVSAYVHCDMAVSTSEQALLNSIVYVGIVISSHFWGFLADTWGRQRVLKVALGGSFLCSFFSAFSINFLMMILTRLFVGILWVFTLLFDFLLVRNFSLSTKFSFEIPLNFSFVCLFVEWLSVSGTQAAAYSYIGEFHSNATRTRASSFVAMFMPACFLYLPIIAYFIMPMNWEIEFNGLKIHQWRLFLLAASLVNGVNFGFLCLLPETPKFLLSMDKEEKTLEVLQRMFAFNTGRPKSEYPVKMLIKESAGTSLKHVHGIANVLTLLWNQTWPLFAPPHLWNTLKLSYLTFILFSAGHGAFIWFPGFLIRMQTHANEAVTLCSIVSEPVIVSTMSSIRLINE